MSKRIHPASLAAVLVGVLAIGSLSAGPGPRGGGMMKHFDADGDGVVSVEEIRARNLERAEAIDANKDGIISIEELEAHRQLMRAERQARRQQHWLERLDANKDGVVSVEEFVAAREAMIQRLDRNGNGIIDPEERPRRGRGHHGR